jgi:hypothetical protein
MQASELDNLVSRNGELIVPILPSMTETSVSEIPKSETSRAPLSEIIVLKKMDNAFLM